MKQCVISTLTNVCPSCFYPLQGHEWGKIISCEQCETPVKCTQYGVRKLRKKELSELRRKGYTA